MYSGEYDACDVTLSVYPHRASLKNMPDHGGNRTTTFGILGVAQLAEHWASIPKVVGSIPTVVRHIFQACPVWIYTQSNITSIIDNQQKYLIYCFTTSHSRLRPFIKLYYIGIWQSQTIADHTILKML